MFPAGLEQLLRAAVLERTRSHRYFQPVSTPKSQAAPSPPHGAEDLSHVRVDAYNAELRNAEGFVGDRASKRAFQEILDDLRERVGRMGEDPLGDTPSDELSKKELDKVLLQGDAEAAALLHGVIEEFAQEFEAVIRRFLRQKEWKHTERIVVGGGFRGSRVGELAIARTSVALKANGYDIELQPIHHAPDHAGLIGCMHLVPSWMLAGHDGILAVDIGGSNIRAGIVAFRDSGKGDLPDAEVTRLELWRHREDAPKRDDAVARLTEFLVDLEQRAAKDGLKLAPFIGVGCPGVILEDGTIDRGGQNLPGNWEAKKFNLPQRLREALPSIGGHDTLVVMHNDAVVQGLSELPWMQDVEHWGVMTIGTGLGNAHYTNRPLKKTRAAKKKA